MVPQTCFSALWCTVIEVLPGVLSSIKLFAQQECATNILESRFLTTYISCVFIIVALFIDGESFTIGASS